MEAFVQIGSLFLMTGGTVYVSALIIKNDYADGQFTGVLNNARKVRCACRRASFRIDGSRVEKALERLALDKEKTKGKVGHFCTITGGHKLKTGSTHWWQCLIAARGRES